MTTMSNMSKIQAKHLICINILDSNIAFVLQESFNLITKHDKVMLQLKNACTLVMSKGEWLNSSIKTNLLMCAKEHPFDYGLVNPKLSCLA